MKNKRFVWEILLVIASAIMLISAGILFGFSQKDEPEETEYNVRIKIASSLGDEWIFDLDTDELTWEHEYTGENIDFRVDRYNMPDHPRYKESWNSPNHLSGDAVFYSNCEYYDTEGNWDQETAYRPAKERGKYKYDFMVDGCSQLIKYRRVTLTVIIK